MEERSSGSSDQNTSGFDGWFRARQAEILGPGQRPARVTAVNRDNYLVRLGADDIRAELSGAFSYRAASATDLPVTGDWAAVELYDEGSLAIIQSVFPRKTVLKRKTAGKDVDYQLLAANVDRALIIQAVDYDFNLRRLERYLVMAREGGIVPVILLSKSDLVSAETLAQRVSEVRDIDKENEVICYSSRTGAGTAEVKALLEPGRTCCLLGSSGTGKTTLLNVLLGRDAFETAEVRADDGKGRHTTTRRQLVTLDSGASVIDTPGIREVGNIGVTDAIGGVFQDVSALAALCRFNDCTHTAESGCAVREGLETGKISEGRYLSYQKLLKESAHNEMSYAEKRNKDRQFGRFIKSVTKFDKRKPGKD
jgi:ribosome biogenesis GTPase